MCAIFCGRRPAKVEDITIQHFLAHDEPQIPAHSGRIYHFNILIDKYNIKRRYSNKIWPLPAYIVTICQLSSFYFKNIIMIHETLHTNGKPSGNYFTSILLKIKSHRSDWILFR